MKYLLVIPIAVLTASGLLWWLGHDRYGTSTLKDLLQRTPAANEAQKDATPSTSQTPPASFSSSEKSGSPILETIIVPGCTLAAIQEQNVSSQLDGLLQEINVTLGQKVAKGTQLGKLDDGKVVPQVELLQIKASSRTDELIAEAMFHEADEKVKYAEKANKQGWKAVSELEYRTYLVQRDRFTQEIKKAREEQQTARKELDKCKVLHSQHFIQAGFDGEVLKIYKNAGETVKQAETLFRIARMDRLKIDGFCKMQDAPQLRPGMQVLVEPELQGAQIVELVGHTDVVHDLAIAGDGKLLASASEDRRVLLWSWPGGKGLGALNHPAAVLSVDVVSVPGNAAQYLIATGCEDGRLRTWLISDGGAAGRKGEIIGPIHEMQGHDGPVRAVRLARDGSACASGGADRKIGWWNVQTGKLGCWVHEPGAWKQSAHQGVVTDIQLGPDGMLASTSSDNMHKIWIISGNQPALLQTFRGRTGDIARLSLSSDGRNTLFDHCEELRVVDTKSGVVLGVLQHWKHDRFQGFACFSPSAKLILSAAPDGRLHLWKTPTSATGKDLSALRPAASSSKEAGGFEIRHYRLPKVAQTKIGVFAPDERVFFTAGSDRLVRAWAVPPPANWQPYEAVLTFVSNEIEQGTDLVRIQAELNNAGDPSRALRPGTAVNLKIMPTP